MNKLCLLGDLVEFFNGDRSKNYPNGKDFVSDGIPFISASELEKGRVDLSGSKFITQDAFDRLKAGKIKNGDILYCLRGTLAKIGLVKEINKGAIASSLTIIRPKKNVDARFIYYYLASPIGQQEAFSLNNGSAQPNISVKSISQILLKTPSYKEQCLISGILGALDDKIELNRQMNETLEAMARALFRDWFVDFGPTRRKAAGETDPVKILGQAIPSPQKAAPIAKLFPDKLGEDGLPFGWEKQPLDQIANFLNGLALQKYPAKNSSKDLAVIKIAELRSGITAKSNRASLDVPSKYIIQNGDFIFSWSGSLMAKFWTGGVGALNQHLFKVTSEIYPMWFVAEWVQHHLEEFQQIAASKAVTMGHIKRSHLTEALCTIPNTDSLKKFTSVLEPMIEKQIQNDLETQTLAQMRDLLLPKLMSGEIRLKDVEAKA